MSLWRIFRWPLAIGLLTVIGLVSGLVSDGWGDAIAALGLFMPPAVIAWLLRGRRPHARSSVAPASESLQPESPAAT